MEPDQKQCKVKKKRERDKRHKMKNDVNDVKRPQKDITRLKTV